MFAEGEDDRRLGTAFKKGYDPRRNAGGKPKVMRDFTTALRTEPAEYLVTQLKLLMASKHQPTSLAAWKEWAKWTLGPAPPVPVDDGDDDDGIDIDPKLLLKMVERDLHRRALAGDPAAQLLVLRALDPRKYGGDGTPDLGDAGIPPSLNIVGIGEARAEHKPDDA